jgi:serine/threonine protein phosphatase PrpC
MYILKCIDFSYVNIYKSMCIYKFKSLHMIFLSGLAMSRSLCDQVAHSVGVSSVPECFERELDPNLDCILIIATDGLWEFMNDQVP